MAYVDGRARVGRQAQAAGVDRLRAGVGGAGGDGQAKIGRTGTSNPTAERRDGLFNVNVLAKNVIKHTRADIANVIYCCRILGWHRQLLHLRSLQLHWEL